MQIENTFIYLLGFSGTGKLTIAREIQKLIPSILVDNHLINNVLFSLIEPDGSSPLPPKIWENLRVIRNVVLDTIRTLAQPSRNFIFTNELVEGDEIDAQLFEEIAHLAKDRKAFLFPVRLIISPDEICRRIISPDRKARFKATNPVSIRERLSRSEVIKPKNYHYFELDVSTLKANISAEKIIIELKKQLGV